MHLEQPLNPFDPEALFKKGGVENRKKLRDAARKLREKSYQEEESTLKEIKDSLNKIRMRRGNN